MTVARAAAAAAAAILLGSPAVASAQSSQTVAGTRVAAVAGRIAHQLADAPDREVVAAFAPGDQSVPDGDVSIAANGAPYVTPTYVGVPIAIRVDGKIARTLVAGYRVVSYVRTAVAARDLAPGTILALGDVAVERVASLGRPAVGADALAGRKLRAAAAKGAPLYVEQTVPDDVVKAGQPAILVVHDGAVALCADVVARSGGAIGDTITVVNPQTRKAIAGIVTGPNRVELTLPQGER